MKNRKKVTNNGFVKIIPLLLVLVVFMITIGYSAISDVFVINNFKAAVRLDKPIRITGFRVVNNNHNGSTLYDEYSFDTVVSGITLPYADSTVTYEVSITNLGSDEMGLFDITGLPSNMEYTISGYNLESTLCDSVDNTQCTLGSTTVIQMTVGYTENGFAAGNTNYDLSLQFDFEEMIYTARMNGNYYLTIQDAINAAPTDNTETTITLLKNVYQRIRVWRGNNIVLDMPNLVLHNLLDSQSASGDPVIEIFGNKSNDKDTSGVVGTASFKMINGTIISEVNQGAINVEPGGTFIMTGGSILTSGNRQAVYIKSGGTAHISGTAYLRSTAEIDSNVSPPNYRATVHNFAGTLTITGGTIEAVGTNGIALTSESTTTIGTEDGTVSTTVPTFIGKDTGIRIKTGTTFNFYDGVAKGKGKAIINADEIDDVETGYGIVYSGETISGDSYLTGFLGNNSVTLTFAPNQGTVSESTRAVVPGAPVGPLPVPTRSGYDFDYWYDSNGTPVDENSTISANTTYTAHWTGAACVQIDHGDGTYSQYSTLASAISAAPNNTQTVIELLRNISENVTVASSKNVVFDFNGYTLSNSGKNVAVTNKGTLEIRSGTISTDTTLSAISNDGNLTITGGTIRSSSNNASAINNNAGATMSMSGGAVVATGARQAIYDDGGTVTISGTSELSSAAKWEGTGKPRATVQANAATSNITILGGTIICTYSSGVAVTNLGTVTIGAFGGGIDATTPVLRANSKDVYSTGTLSIYDGLLQSKTTTFVDGTITNSEPNTQPHTGGTAVIGGVTYNTWYLESIS